MYDVAEYTDLINGRRRGPSATLQRWLLLAASWPYGLVVAIRNWLYEVVWHHGQRAAAPVVSVGNLTVGGTGKTPCVEYVAGFYREQALRVAILSRGYGSAGGPNDEAMLLEENRPDVPHLQGPDRIGLAVLAVEELESELLILDDGFQHRRLARDLDLVLIDATQPWGFGYLLPRGFLRESRRSLRRASAILLTRCDAVTEMALNDLKTEVHRYAPNAPVIETVHRPLMWVNSGGQTRPLAAFQVRPALAFCGIGNPESFRQTLGRLDIAVAKFRAFPDHHAYRRADVDELEQWADGGEPRMPVLTTQKDLVKLRIPQLAGRELWALRIELAVRSDEAGLHRLLASVMAVADTPNLGDGPGSVK